MEEREEGGHKERELVREQKMEGGERAYLLASSLIIRRVGVRGGVDEERGR